MPNQIAIKFIDENNQQQYRKAVLTWLKSDFDSLEEPECHFWHNRSIIEKAFDNCNALVALNNQEEFIGYMIWSIYDPKGRAEIDIVEVKEAYRKQGIFNNMLTSFTEKFTEICVLSASVIPTAEVTFNKAGWKSIKVPSMEKKYYKIVKPALQPTETLPDGHVIAVCSEDYYLVKGNPSKYENSMKYFQIHLDENRKLDKPIITVFNYEGYVGIYLNKELIIDGKAKHLFENKTCWSELNLLIIASIEPIKPNLFNEKDFFSQLPKEDKDKKRTLITETDSTVIPTTAEGSDNQQIQKKQRVKTISEFFKPEKCELAVNNKIVQEKNQNKELITDNNSTDLKNSEPLIQSNML